MSSQFRRYWARIDNCPGALEYATPEQLREVKAMVSKAFHHIPHNKREATDRIKAENKRLQALLDAVRDALEEAMGWNWLDEIPPPPEVIDKCEAALKEAGDE